jgi:catechol 2,3-dioxygenase-like lactoylglutathione lyase family enzyme
VASSVWPQAAKPSIRLRSLASVTLAVSDLKRSVEFYQGLFGIPVQFRQADSVGLRVGSGPQHIRLVQGAKPQIQSFSMSVEKFGRASIAATLAAHGVAHDELFLADPDGTRVQLHDARYCGGSACAAVEKAPSKGLLPLRDLSHVTVYVRNGLASLAFYQQVFAMPVLSRQGANGIGLAVGSHRQFVFLSSAGRTPQINHCCLTMPGFKLEAVFQKLAGFGLKPRPSADAPVGPLMYYISLRMPDRGGAPGGTPELYFTDPDGLVIQLQDPSYCGGSGVLGDVCG